MSYCSITILWEMFEVCYIFERRLIATLLRISLLRTFKNFKHKYLDAKLKTPQHNNHYFYNKLNDLYADYFLPTKYIFRVILSPNKHKNNI